MSHAPTRRAASARLTLLIFAALTLGIAACSQWWNGGKPDLYTGDLIKCPHDKHKAAKVDCLACHEELYDAKELGGNFRPPEAKCMECHKEEKAKGNCAMCHTDVSRAAAYPKREPSLHLSHAAHIDRVKEDCSACHKTLPQPVRTQALAPKMAACLDCHNHKDDFQQGKCALCHIDLKRYPIKPISEFSHQGDFIKQHGASARSSVDSCAQCHEQTFCTDCHASTVSTRIEIKYSEKVDSDFIHRNDFVSRHSIEAHADEASCKRCHGESFCTSCHAAQNLTSSAANPRNPHPPGWAFPGTPNNHAVAARRDITACAACHEDGPRSVCITCHKVGGVGGNPHPPAWQQQHPSGEIGRNGMCLYCHL